MIRAKFIFSAPTVLLAALCCMTKPALGLPIGFGYNQGDLKFTEMRSQNFIVYFDKRAPEDAKLAIRSLEAARPSIERWFEVERSSPLIVNMSAASENASFANFITDSIELQTMGQGSRDLAWHEYTHSSMYRQLDNILGPAGAIIHLPWMEAWFLEGLAESLSVALGSDEQAGMERYHALTNSWPSWDRIHSLYTSGPFNYRGYATSGAFVAWILRTYGADKIPELLRTFRSKSMPWYWPWALTPLNGFLPMDRALQSATGKTGRELYEQYKIDATAHWKSQVTVPVLMADTTNKIFAPSPWSWQLQSKKLLKTTPPPDSVSYKVAIADGAKSWTTDYYPRANQQRVKVVLAEDGKRPQSIERESSWIEGPWISASHVWWAETFVENTRLCYAPRKVFVGKSVKCVITGAMPDKLRILGADQNESGNLSKTIWLVQDHESLAGDYHTILEIDLQSAQIKSINPPVGGRPISMARSASGLWLLNADRSWRHLVKLTNEFQCSGIVEIGDFPIRLVESDKELPHVVLFSAQGYSAEIPDPAKFPVKACRRFSPRSSPLLEAMRSASPLSFPDAVARSNIWAKTGESSEQKSQDNMTQNNYKNPAGETPSIETAQWRGRPVFAFPWIGADDALGPQLGIISVPMMDHMQNETLRATLLVGTASRFPYQDINLTSTRFAPTWSISGFRSQTYNGRYRDKASGLILSSFLEESGLRVDGNYSQRWKYLSLEYDWGIKASNLKPYIGPTRRRGHLNEPYAGITATISGRSRYYSQFSLRGRGAPAGMNRVYQYDVVGSSITSGIKVGSGKLETGVDASRTRGPRRRDLQELYQPLKTLIPASGAGYNQNSFAVSEDYGLFTPSFGENQARARILATHPVIENFDKFLGGLIYIDELVGSGFFNYGTAWRDHDMPKLKELKAAQGYSLDLFMDNKGVKFNLGGGIGQVLGQPWQAYWTFGFDALF